MLLLFNAEGNDLILDIQHAALVWQCTLGICHDVIIMSPCFGLIALNLPRCNHYVTSFRPHFCCKAQLFVFFSLCIFLQFIHSSLHLLSVLLCMECILKVLYRNHMLM